MVSFECTVSNSNGETDTSTTTVFVVDSSIGFGVDDIYTVPVGQTFSVNAPGILSNDIAPPGGVLSAQNCILNQSNSGTLSSNPQGGFTFIPAANFVGVASFTCTISDGIGGTDPSTTSILVVDPSAGFTVLDPFITPPGQPLIVDAPGILGNDTPGPGETLSVQSCNLSNSNSGFLSFNPQGGFTFIPAANFVGIASFTCTVSNSNGSTDTSTSIVFVGTGTIPGPGEDGFTVDDAYMIQSGRQLSVDAPGILANDIAGPGEVLTVQSFTQPSSGTLSMNPQGGFTFMPSSGFTGVVSFECTVSNSNGGTDTSTITVNVIASPTAPSAPTISPAPTTTAFPTKIPDSGGGQGGFISQISALWSTFFQGVLALSFGTVNGVSSVFQLIFTFIFGGILGGLGGISIWGLWDWFYYYCLSYYCYY